MYLLISVRPHTGGYFLHHVLCMSEPIPYVNRATISVLNLNISVKMDKFVGLHPVSIVFNIEDNSFLSPVQMVSFKSFMPLISFLYKYKSL